MPWWTWVWPLLAWAVLAAKAVAGSNAVLLAAAGVCLLGAVFAAVYHAELIAHRIGEPSGRWCWRWR